MKSRGRGEHLIERKILKAVKMKHNDGNVWSCNTYKHCLLSYS